jgi:hypothetical protein
MNEELFAIFASVINALLLAALPVLAGVALGAAYAWGRKTWAEFQSMRPDVAYQLAMYARIAVEAAEQAGAAKLIQNKKAYAIEVTQTWLEQIGLRGVDAALIAAEIERQVRQMNLELYAPKG